MVNINDLKLDEIDYEIEKINKELPHLELMDTIWELRKQLPKGVYFPDGIDEFDLPLIEKLSPDVSIYFNYKEKRKKEKELRGLGLILLSRGQVTYRLEDCREKLYSLNNLRRKKLEPQDTSVSTPQTQGKTKDVLPFPTPTGTQWHEVNIYFIDSENVKISARDKTETKHFFDMGFRKGKTCKPVKSWDALFAFSKKECLTYSQSLKSKTEKDIQDLRKRLKAYFGIQDDPFILEHDGYKPVFKVCASESEGRSVRAFPNSDIFHEKEDD